MPKVSPQDGAKKWADNTKRGIQYVAAGVDRVTESPTQKAAEKLDKMLQNFMEAVQSGKIKRGLERVSLQDWKDAMKNVGVQRIAGGVDAKGLSKMEAFTAEFYPFLERLQAEIDDMPDTTLEDNISRMVKNVRGIAEFKRSG